MRYLISLFAITIMLSSCRDRDEVDSFLVVNLLMNKGIINWYTPEQREILRQEIEMVLRD